MNTLQFLFIEEKSKVPWLVNVSHSQCYIVGQVFKLIKYIWNKFPLWRRIENIYESAFLSCRFNCFCTSGTLQLSWLACFRLNQLFNYRLNNLLQSLCKFMTIVNDLKLLTCTLNSFRDSTEQFWMTSLVISIHLMIHAKRIKIICYAWRYITNSNQDHCVCFLTSGTEYSSCNLAGTFSRLPNS